MKAGPLSYVRASSVAEALSLLERHRPDAKLVAGGQSLLPALNLRLSSPAVLIDIGRIESMRGINVVESAVRIGALTTHAELMASPEIGRHVPLLARAAPHIAHPAIRNRGTIGGSLANADPAAELPACALALGARIHVASPGGTRVVPAESFFTGLFETALTEGDILTAVEVDAIAPVQRSGFGELARRSGDYAIVGLAAHGGLDGGVFTALRLAYFAVGTRAVLARTTAGLLTGRTMTEATLRDAVAALAEDLEPHDDLQASAATRLRLAGVLLRRVMADMLPAARLAA